MPGMGMVILWGVHPLTGILVCVSGDGGHDTVAVEHLWWSLAQKCFKLNFLYILKNWGSA